MESFNYNRDDFITNYRLTNREFMLLGDAEKLEYCHKLYGKFIDMVPKVGDKTEVRGHLSESVRDYFSLCGCTFENSDYGIVGVVELRRESKAKFKSSKEAVQNLEAYIKSVASIKADIIESELSEYYTQLKEQLTDNFNTLAREDGELSSLLEAELTPLITRLDSGETVTLEETLPLQYKMYLSYLGYALTNKGKKLKIYKAI